MAPKKKSKGNKLAKMSDDERARYLQHRADIEEEARRRKQELISKYLKNKLQKEEQYGKINAAKLNQAWRFILRKIKCRQMEGDIKGMSSLFVFMVERKNNILKVLTKAIDEAEDQHNRMLQAHMENINQFLETGSDRLQALQDEYELQKCILLEDWDREYQHTSKKEEKSEFQLQLVIFQQRQDLKKNVAEKEYSLAILKNEENILQEQNFLDMKRPKESELESYWNTLRSIYLEYVERHNPIINHYNVLREKDDFYKRDIARHVDKLASTNDLLISLQKEWSTNNDYIALKLRNIQEEKDELTKNYWKLKKFAKDQSRTNNEDLTLMVNTSEATIESLGRYKSKIEKILQMVKVCQKYEIEEDYYTWQSGEKGEEGNTISRTIDLNDSEHFNEAMKEEYKTLEQLDIFWLRFNRVKIHTAAIRAEKDSLVRENEQLKNYMKKYLTELAVRDKTGHQPVSRPTSMQLYQSEGQKAEINELRSPWNNRPVTCIEAATSNVVIHEKRMKVWNLKEKQSREIKVYTRY